MRSLDPVFIPLSDGTRLAARLWLPDDVSEPVPAILEAVPYRRNDGTFLIDQPRYSWWADSGYAGVRVDLRGSGDSDGVMTDEYLRKEQDDNIEVLQWLAEQPWCSGKVAMIGFSWGGFAGLQLAARQPKHLAAIVTINSTVRRYTDDCHYTGGAVNAHDMLSWAMTMYAFNARPPDPRVVGERWRAMWAERLGVRPPMIEHWLSHPLEDDFWRHGSVCVNYDAITVPVLAVGGWADPYRNAVLDLRDNLSGECLGIIGPWAHGYPHATTPGPMIDFLGECTRFFDRHLRGVDAPAPPSLRIYVQDADDPTADDRSTRPGEWMAIERVQFAEPMELSPGTVASDERCGSVAGAWCPYGSGAIAGDQHEDDALSCCTDSAWLIDPLTIAGFPEVRLRVSVDRPLAFVAVRLCDVAPDGTSLLVTRGILNLTHRNGHDSWEPLEPGREYDVMVRLDAAAHRFAAGRRIRIAISPSYWPWIWPSPEPVVLTVHGGTALLPELTSATSCAFDGPVAGAPATLHRLAPRLSDRQPDFLLGRLRIGDLDVEVEEGGDNEYSCDPHDPLSATVRVVRRLAISRPDWDTRVEVESTMTCTHGTFRVESTLTAFDGNTEVHRSQHITERPRVGG